VESGLLAGPGNYKIILTASARDGSESKQATIDNVTIRSFSTDAELVDLDPLGEEIDFHNGHGLERIWLASGDSPYYFEAVRDAGAQGVQAGKSSCQDQAVRELR
jgi:hypothetical protein